MLVSKERKGYLLEKFKYAAKEFGKSGTKFNHKTVPKEQQLSIDLGNKKVFGIINRIFHWIESKFTYFLPRYNLFPEVGVKERKIPGNPSCGLANEVKLRNAGLFRLHGI